MHAEADPSGGSSSSARAAAAHATCKCQVEQHYQYRWDELNRIAEARRYDRDGTVTTPPETTPEWKLALRQRYRYDSANVRTVKQTLETIVDTANSDDLDDTDGDPPERLTLYVYPGDFERRGLTRNVARTAYVEADGRVGGVKVVGTAETQYIVGGARVVWEATSEPTQLDGTVTKTARVTIGIGDLIGTTAAVLDLESGELVEASTYHPNGARESYVRNGGGDDAAIAPEPMGFTGKEGDEEVGLTYFGERYLVARIGRWASPDPAEVQDLSGGETLNSYHYVAGNMLQKRDHLGLQPVPAGPPPKLSRAEQGRLSGQQQGGYRAMEEYLDGATAANNARIAEKTAEFQRRGWAAYDAANNPYAIQNRTIDQIRTELRTSMRAALAAGGADAVTLGVSARCS